MRTRTIGTGIGALLLAPAMLFTMPATANAAVPSEPIVVAGRERVKFTLLNNTTTFQHCTAEIVGGDHAETPLNGFNPGDTYSVVLPAAPGPRQARVFCLAGIAGVFIYDRILQVEPANPVLDAVDAVLGGVGSSALTTDPTLR
jgi:hypothetical protein